MHKASFSVYGTLSAGKSTLGEMLVDEFRSRGLPVDSSMATSCARIVEGLA